MTDLMDIHQELNVHVHSQGENVDRIGIHDHSLLKVYDN